MDKNVNAPILKGQKLGEVSYSINGSIVSTVNIIADKEVGKLNFASIAKSTFAKWFNLFRV